MTRFTIRLARKIFKDYFEEDESFRETYKANISMLLYDRYDWNDNITRNRVADDIMAVIFDAKEFKKSCQGFLSRKKVSRTDLMDI